MLLQVILLFETYPAFVCLREMERILVQWSNERSKGMTSLERKTAVNTGVITVSEKVVVSWGKTKKTYNAQVISLSSAQAPASHGTTRNALEDQFCCNVADPALSTADPAPSTADPAPSSGDQHAPEGQQEERFSTILQMLDSLSERIDNFSDMLLSVVAHLVCNLWTFEEKVSALQPPRDYPLLPVMPMPPPTMEMVTLWPSYLLPIFQTHLESPQPLSDIG